MIDDDKFYAWLDGELSVDEANAVAAAVAADPALSRKAEQHRALQSRLRGAFAPLLAAPVPDQIAAPPIDFAAARGSRQTSRTSAPRGVSQWMAIAATLVVGLTVGTLVGEGGGGNSPLAVEGGQMIAAAALDEALDTRIASAGQPGAGPRIGLTYRASDGHVCRTFSGVGGSSGLACNVKGAWQVRGLFSSDGATSGEYRMAAGEDPRLAALVAEGIAGEPFDAAQEQAAKAKRWR